MPTNNTPAHTPTNRPDPTAPRITAAVLLTALLTTAAAVLILRAILRRLRPDE